MSICQYRRTPVNDLLVLSRTIRNVRKVSLLKFLFCFPFLCFFLYEEEGYYYDDNFQSLCVYCQVDIFIHFLLSCLQY